MDSRSGDALTGFAAMAGDPSPGAAQAPTAAASPATPEPAAASLTEQLSATSLTLGGYIKTDVIYSTARRSGFSGGDDLSNYFLVPSLIPINDTGQDNGGVTLNARESRIFFKTETTTQTFGTATAYLDVDFYGINAGLGDERITNSSSVRIRKATIAIGPVTFGQDHSTFVDLSTFPEQNDFGSPAGRAFVRQPLVRWTKAFTGQTALDVSFESPETTLLRPENPEMPLKPSEKILVADNDRFPDFAMRMHRTADRTYLSVSILVREIRAAIAEGAAPRSEVAFAARASGRLHIWTKDQIKMEGIVGRGIGRYISLNAFTAGLINDMLEIELIDVVGGHLSYQHWWSDTVRSTAVVSHARAVGSVKQEDANRRLDTLHLNLMWNITPEARIGAEGIYGRREVHGGAAGSLRRFQFSVKYSF